MKKSFFYAAMLAVAVAFVGCKDTQTPETDTTKLWPAMSGELWGYIDANGKLAISPMFERVYNFSCGYARVWMTNSTTPYFIDTKGKMQQASFDDADDFYYKYSRIVMNDLDGLMSTSFDYSCQPMFYGLGIMSENGLVSAKLTSKDKCGYVNAKGENKIPAMYDYAGTFEGGVAVVGIGSKCGAINTKGDYVIQPMYDDLEAIGHGMIAFVQNDKIGLMNAGGKVVVQPIYEGLGYLVDNDLIPAYRNDKCGFINKSGDEKIAFVYDACSSFYEGYAVVYQNDVERVIDTKGNIVMTIPEGDEIYSAMHNGLALVRSYQDNGDRVYKYVDKDYKVVYQWIIEANPGWSAPAKKVSRQERLKNLVEETIHFDSRNL